MKTQKKAGADLIKIIVSGLMDFSQFGVLTLESLPAEENKELIHIAHEEGLSVMAHCNGTEETWLKQAGITEDRLQNGIRAVMNRF